MQRHPRRSGPENGDAFHRRIVRQLFRRTTVHRNISTDTGVLRTIFVVVLPTKNSRIWEWP